jgi:hypothetical protein
LLWRPGIFFYLQGIGTEWQIKGVPHILRTHGLMPSRASFLQERLWKSAVIYLFLEAFGNDLPANADSLFAEDNQNLFLREERISMSELVTRIVLVLSGWAGPALTMTLADNVL